MKTKLLYKITSWTLTSAVCRALFWAYCYIKDWQTVEESLHGKAFQTILKKYLKMDARVDWLGRVYGVVNPAIDESGKFDYNSMIFEIDGPRTNNQEWVEQWLYKQMMLVNNVFNVQRTGFFDIIDATVTHVGPENSDNYLIVFDIASRKEMARRWKRVFWQTLCYGMICGIGLLIF